MLKSRICYGKKHTKVICNESHLSMFLPSEMYMESVTCFYQQNMANVLNCHSCDDVTLYEVVLADWTTGDSCQP